MRQQLHSSAVRPTAGVRNPYCRRESRGGIAQLLINRVAGLQLKFVQCRPDGAFRRVTCMSFRERRCLNAANLGHHQDTNASDNCVIQQVVWHVMIGHSAQFTPGSARHCGDHAVITWTQPHHSCCASKVTASSTISVRDNTYCPAGTAESPLPCCGEGRGDRYTYMLSHYAFTTSLSPPCPVIPVSPLTCLVQSAAAMRVWACLRDSPVMAWS
jgi:hypothetical protein